jgi:DNA-binding NtrC family response regulator
MTDIPKILIVEEEERIAKGFSTLLQKKGFQTIVAHKEHKILSTLELFRIAIVLLSMDRKDEEGVSLIRTILKAAPEIVCIAITSGTRASETVQALDAGASDCFSRPIRDWDRFLGVCTQALAVSKRTYMREEQRAHMENLQKHKSIEGFIPIKGNSPSVRTVMDTIRLVAPLKVSTLIYGESGVGKELVARAIHQESPSRLSPFIAINCVAIQPELFESELFGHERGAFTGAYTQKDGLCRQAKGGTLFLDEIGDLPLRLQPKLLRLLEQRVFRPVGSTKMHEFRARVICATHVDLESAVQQGLFRKDLYFRISAQEIYVPPLRTRKDDIQLLAYTFIEKYNKLCKRDVQRISSSALRRLESHDWIQNNVRELEREIQRAVVRAGDATVLDETMLFVKNKWKINSKESKRDFSSWLEMEYTEAQKESKRDFLERYLTHKLDAAHGNKSKAARLSGLASSNFHRLLRQLEGLQKEKDSQDPDT